MGFDKRGFDKQGYNKNGEYKEYINSYLSRNKDIKSQTTTAVYSEEFKNIMLNLDKARKLIRLGYYEESSMNLRIAFENFACIVIKFKKPNNSYTSNSGFKNLSYINDCNLLDNNQINVLHQVRMLGNHGTHGKKASQQDNKALLNSLKEIIHNWMNENLPD